MRPCFPAAKPDVLLGVRPFDDAVLRDAQAQRQGKAAQHFLHLLHHLRASAEAWPRSRRAQQPGFSPLSETWLREQLKNLVETEGLVERVVEMAHAKCEGDLGPQQEALELCRQALRENQTKVDRLLESVASGEVSGPLLSMLNAKASELQREQERLKAEERGLQQALIPLRSHFDAQVLRNTLHRFDVLCEAATSEEVQQMVRAMVHRIEWHPIGDSHTLELYALPQTQNQSSSGDEDWLEIVSQLSCPRPRTFEPLILRLQMGAGQVVRVLNASIRAASSS